MKRFKIIAVLCVSLLVCSSMQVFVAAASKNTLFMNEPLLKVGLWTAQSSVAISADGPFIIRNADNKKIIRHYKAGNKVFVASRGEKLKIDNKEEKVMHLYIELEQPNADTSLELNRKSYRGKLELIYNPKAGITVINEVALEPYLYSIVPGEMPAGWHLEAVKAQAVAARSFALESCNKHSAAGFDVCATTHCQVYNGRQAELPRSTKAVDATRGLVMLYNNKPIAAVFHSSSGGYTENSEDVWGNYCPYLRSVKDMDEAAPNYRWQIKMTPAQMQSKLAAYGYSLGKLQAIELSPLQKDGENAADRTARGRIKTIRFIGDKGNIALTGSKVRTIFSLNSTLFDISLEVPAQRKIDVPIGQYYKKAIAVELPPYKEQGLLTDSKNLRRVLGRNDEEIVINGFGWGHGLGLSQWGAKGMADKVPETQDLYFKEILQHYYLGITLQKVY